MVTSTDSITPRWWWLVPLLLVACSPERGPQFRPAGNPTPRDGGTLRYATSFNVRTLDPIIAYDEVSAPPVDALFDTLLDYESAATGSSLRVVPALAEHWTISPDGLVYTFTLRPSITYSDGTPIVARDFKYSLERVLATPDSPFGPYLGDIEGAAAVTANQTRDCTGITAPSEHELVIRLAQPNMAFLHIMAMTFTTPQRRDHVERAGDQLRRMPLGSGPFIFDRWDEGRRLVLRRNPAYWNRAQVHLDRIELYENVPRDTQFMMFERGELDTAERLTAPDELWVTTNSAWQPYVHHRIVMNAFGARMNVRKKPFDDRRVRQALNYALDKSHTVKLLGGSAIAAHGMLIPGMFGRDESLAPYPHDPAKARALLAEAGYPNGFEVEYVILADDEAEKLAVSLRADLADVGVRVNLSRLSAATFLSTVGKPDGPPFSMFGWIADFPDPVNFLDAKFHSRMITGDNSANDSFYANPELDAVLDRARKELDADQRAALYRRAERILYDDAPWIWNYHQTVTEVLQPYVAGYQPHPVRARDYTTAWLDVGPDGPLAR